MSKATRRRTQSKSGPRKRAGEAKRAPSRRWNLTPLATGKLAIGVDRSRLMRGEPPVWIKGDGARITGVGSIILAGSVRLVWDSPADGRDPTVHVEVTGQVFESDDD